MKFKSSPRFDAARNSIPGPTDYLNDSKILRKKTEGGSINHSCMNKSLDLVAPGPGDYDIYKSTLIKKSVSFLSRVFFKSQ